MAFSMTSNAFNRHHQTISVVVAPLNTQNNNSRDPAAQKHGERLGKTYLSLRFQGLSMEQRTALKLALDHPQDFSSRCSPDKNESSYYTYISIEQLEVIKPLLQSFEKEKATLEFTVTPNPHQIPVTTSNLRVVLEGVFKQAKKEAEERKANAAFQRY